MMEISSLTKTGRSKFKARLVVAKGYAPLARLDTVRLILGLAAQRDWEVFQLNVKSSEIHGELKEEVFVHKPEGFIKIGEVLTRCGMDNGNAVKNPIVPGTLLSKDEAGEEVLARLIKIAIMQGI
ncbi:retrovirus-related pol polyprotein from transposon TNT 1-94 [Tanacetum coccineum]|uniref:Retrovirus-related pol polyprotein from transposon TNT 1-94 n=1 Tax=Tanacetum coccineum TaxID=301880 RepID=A0ABQ5E6J6_9ASTR